MEGEKRFAPMKNLKVGKYVIIDGAPCKVVGIEVSAPGKHGHAKWRVTAVGIFDGAKRTLLKPSNADVEVPIIERKVGQAITITGDTTQIMDLTTFETFEINIPDELREKLQPGNEVEYMEWGGRRLLLRVKRE